MALLGLEPGDDADELRAGSIPYSSGSVPRTAPDGRARQIDAVVDEADGRLDALLVDQLVLDGARYGVSWSMCGVQSRRCRRSSSERTRLEWTVETTYGRRCPISARAIAARVPTVSARYMWLWMTSARISDRCAARRRPRSRPSGSSMTSTSNPARWSLRTALPGEEAPRSRRHTGRGPCACQRVEMLLGAPVRPGLEDRGRPDRPPRRLVVGGFEAGSNGPGALMSVRPGRTGAGWVRLRPTRT